MYKRFNEHGYKVAHCLHTFINHEVLPGLRINQQDFWLGQTWPTTC